MNKEWGRKLNNDIFFELIRTSLSVLFVLCHVKIMNKLFINTPSVNVVLVRRKFNSRFNKNGFFSEKSLGVNAKET